MCAIITIVPIIFQHFKVFIIIRSSSSSTLSCFFIYLCITLPNRNNICKMILFVLMWNSRLESKANFRTGTIQVCLIHLSQPVYLLWFPTVEIDMGHIGAAIAEWLESHLLPNCSHERHIECNSERTCSILKKISPSILELCLGFEWTWSIISKDKCQEQLLTKDSNCHVHHH